VVEFDDLPEDPANIVGPKHCKRLKETEAINSILLSMGWMEKVQSDFQQPNFQPERFFPGSVWEREVEKKKQEILDKKNEHNISHKVGTTSSKLEGSNMVTFQHASSNVVKVVDKSYLEKSFHIDQLSEVIQDTVNLFSLNTEQERAFKIIANHAISANPEQLRMYLGGMGGTGKSQVIKALSSFFEGRKEAHRFIIVAPTGTAAALLGGSTYHSMFGINERMNISKIGHIKAKLSGVEYVFFR
jgi:primosomal protein N'